MSLIIAWFSQPKKCDILVCRLPECDRVPQSIDLSQESCYVWHPSKHLSPAAFTYNYCTLCPSLKKFNLSFWGMGMGDYVTIFYCSKGYSFSAAWMLLSDVVAVRSEEKPQEQCRWLVHVLWLVKYLTGTWCPWLEKKTHNIGNCFRVQSVLVSPALALISPEVERMKSKVVFMLN